jgi:hypothetical protein
VSLFLAIVTALLHLAGRSQSLEVFRDGECHLAFQYPSDWAVRPDTAEYSQPCVYFIEPLALDSLLIEADSVDVYTIWLEVVDGPPDVAGGYAGFERRDDGWVILGRQGAETPGTPYTRNELSGVMGIASIGCYRINGGYLGVCDAPSALVGTVARSVAIRGGPWSEDVVDLIVNTIDLRE